MSEELIKMLKTQAEEDRKLLIKVDAGTITPETLGFNPKLISDERTLIEQLLYLQEVRAEIASRSTEASNGSNA